MDELVKQRLVGSSVLALLALIFIPWMFGDPQDPRTTIQASFDGTPIPVSPASQEEVVLLVPTAKPSAAPTSRPSASPRRYLSKPSSKPESIKVKSTPVPVATPAPTVASSGSAWILQLISYNNKENADEFRAKLSRDGYVAWREEVTVKGKSYYRVRMKVRGSKSQAIDLKAKLEKKYRIQAKLLKG